MNAPVDTQRPFEYHAAVHLTAANLVAPIIEVVIVLLDLCVDVVAGELRLVLTAGTLCGRTLSAEALVRLHAAAVAEELRPKQSTIARHMAIGYSLVLGMLADIQPFAAFLAAQAFRMPIVAQ